MSDAQIDPVRPITLTDDELAFYRREGYLPIPGYLSQDQVSAMVEEVYDHLEQLQGLTRDGLRAASTTADKLRQENRYLAGSLLDRMINSPRTLAIASQLVGGEAIRYLPFAAVKAGGGGGQFHLHQDNNYTRHEPAEGSLNIWVALVDMTPENGCLVVAPRSHQAGQAEAVNAGDGDNHRTVAQTPEQIFPLRMRAGDAVAFTRWTIHGSGPNTTDEPRVAYALQYHRSDVRYADPQTGEWKDLVTDPRWQTEPLERLVAS